jgi:hypothetical protein
MPGAVHQVSYSGLILATRSRNGSTAVLPLPICTPRHQPHAKHAHGSAYPRPTPVTRHLSDCSVCLVLAYGTGKRRSGLVEVEHPLENTSTAVLRHEAHAHRARVWGPDTRGDVSSSHAASTTLRRPSHIRRRRKAGRQDLKGTQAQRTGLGLEFSLGAPR